MTSSHWHVETMLYFSRFDIVRHHLMGFGRILRSSTGGNGMDDRKQILTAREAAEYLRISLASLRRMEKTGHLLPFRTLGGHRRYSLAMLNDYLERSRQPSLAESSAHQQPPVG